MVKVYDTIFTDVYASEKSDRYYESDNLTLAMTDDGYEVTVDDDGIHYDY
jgi:hypothetical protein